MLRKIRVAGCAVGLFALALAGCGQASAPNEEPAATEETPAPGANQPTAGGDSEYCAEVSRRVSPQDCETFGRLADEARAGLAAFNAPNPMQRGEAHTLQLAVSFAPPATEEEPRINQANGEAGEVLARMAEDQAAFDVAQRSNTRQAYEEYLRTYPNGLSASEARERLSQILGGSTDTGVAPAPPAPPPPTPTETVEPLPGQTQEFTPLVGRFMRAELIGDGFEVSALSPASQEVLADSVTTWSWRVVAQEGGLRNLTLRTTVEGCTAEGECLPLRSTTQNYQVEVIVGWSGKLQDFLGGLPNWIKLVTAVLVALAGLVGAWFGLRNAFRKGRES